MKGKKGLIMGVANERSIAWGISQKLAEAGAELAFTYLGDALKKRVVPLAEKLNSDVTFEFNFSASGITLFLRASPRYVKASSAPASANF